MNKGIITAEEIALVRDCISILEEFGADSSRITLNKTIQNGINILDGDIDKITYSIDRSIYVHIFAGGRYGTFSTNRLEGGQLRLFLEHAVKMTRLLSEDRDRRLPDRARKADGCTDGNELELLDERYFDITQDEKIRLALKASYVHSGEKCKLESEDNEYYDSLDDCYSADSDGWEGRHIETSYGFCSEVTVSDMQGNKHCGYNWNGSAFFDKLDISTVCQEAVKMAVMQIGSGRINSGKYTVIVDRNCANRLVGPILNALDGQCIQQGNSFLKDSLGKKVFSGHLCIKDMARTPGRPGSRLFDTEGVATVDRKIIDRGVVKSYFTNTHIANKTGMEPTIEGVSRPCITPFACNCRKKEINLKDILRLFPNALFISGFNGGNCNTATGDFSYGVEGLAIEGGKIRQPFSEVLITGNMKDLWGNLVAAGSDARECARWQIPTLAFENVDINA